MVQITRSIYVTGFISVYNAFIEAQEDGRMFSKVVYWKIDRIGE